MKFEHIKNRVYMSILESKNTDELVEVMTQHLDEVYNKAKSWDKYVEYLSVQSEEDQDEEDQEYY